MLKNNRFIKKLISGYHSAIKTNHFPIFNYTGELLFYF